MNPSATIIKRLLKRKLATAVLVTVSFGAFAIVGDPGGKKASKSTYSPSKPVSYTSKGFSLRSGYNYKGNNFFSGTVKKQSYIMVNTVVTYQKGNTTYIMPLKKKVILDKVKFNPSSR
jgi:hypothetical protein